MKREKDKGQEKKDKENTEGKEKVKKRFNDILIFLLKLEYGVDTIYIKCDFLNYMRK